MYVLLKFQPTEEYIYNRALIYAIENDYACVEDAIKYLLAEALADNDIDNVDRLIDVYERSRGEPMNGSRK